MKTNFEPQLVESLEADIAANRLILPTLPDVALQVRRITAQPDASVPELASVIGRDPALSARLLKVANSAAVRSRQPVDEIRGAIQRLGLRLVRNLVSNLAIIQTFQHGNNGMHTLLRRISEHSTEVAVISHALAAAYTRINPDEAMLAGLVHDIGMLPLLRRVSELAEFRADTSRFEGPLKRLHTRVGAMVLASWNFPPEMVTVAQEHEEVGRISGASPELLDLVIVANLLARRNDPANPYADWEWRHIPAVKKLRLETNADPVSGEHYRRARELIGG